MSFVNLITHYGVGGVEGLSQGEQPSDGASRLPVIADGGIPRFWSVAEKGVDISEQPSRVGQPSVRIREGGVRGILGNYSVPQGVDKIKFGVQVSRRGSCFSLTTREPPELGSTFVFGFLVVEREVVEDGNPLPAQVYRRQDSTAWPSTASYTPLPPS